MTETNIQSGHDRHGEAESTVVFNGEDSHLTLDAFNLNQTGSFSVGFWAQMDPSAFTEPQCLFYEGINGEFHFANADPGVDFTQFHWAAKANSSAWYGPTAGPLNSGEWNHFVGTYDQGMLELFVNGVSVATQQAACCSQAPTDQLVLGGPSRDLLRGAPLLGCTRRIRPLEPGAFKCGGPDLVPERTH